MASRVHCGKCAQNIPKNHRVINCSTCTKFYHVKCCDINTKDFLAIQQSGNSWTCFNCRPKSTGNIIKCFDCKKTIAKNLTPLKCSTCFNQFHSSCGGIKIKDYNKLNNWDCNKCLSGNLPFSGIGVMKFSN